MRVLFVSHTFPLEGEPLSNIGGMQRLAMDQERALAALPHVELTSLVLRSASRWTEVRTVPFLMGLLARIPRIVRERRIELVLFSSMVTAGVAPLLRRRLPPGVELAATPVGRDVTLPNPLHQRLVPRIFRALDRVMPISRATADECLARGVAPEKLRIVPCGVDIGRFPAVEDHRAARMELVEMLGRDGVAPPPDGALLLCSVGRHQERKGFHWFVEEVVPRLPENGVSLLGGSGPMTPRILSTVAERGLDARARVLGRVSEEMLGALFRGSDLFVMPNVRVSGDIEGFGVVMLEAGLCGLPVLAADLEGIRDVVREGENGVLLPSGDVAAFVQAVEAALAPAQRAAAARRARDSVQRRFSWEGGGGELVR